MSERRWTHQTAARVAQCLAEELQLNVSATVVRRLLGEMEYSLKSNKKCLSAGNSPDRDTQFGIIKRLRQEFSEAGEPIISVDTKKKEMIGLFKNSGRTWRRSAKKVKDHDFRSDADGLASPYGIYDVQRNFGVVVVGESADTPEFAVNSILTWWHEHGQGHYPLAKRLLILADGGGSNGARPRVWKRFLQERFADAYGITITVAHYPAGASKWNPIEHRMFSEISKNWAGEPLVTFDTVVNFARDTTTETGLRIEAYRDQRVYEKGKKVSDKEMEEIAITRGDELGKWNYSLQPRVSEGVTPSEPAPKPRRPTGRRPPPAISSEPHTTSPGIEQQQHDEQTVDQPHTENLTNSTAHEPGRANQERLTAYASSSNISSQGEARRTIDRTDHASSSYWSFHLPHLITGLRSLFAS